MKSPRVQERGGIIIFTLVILVIVLMLLGAVFSYIVEQAQQTNVQTKDYQAQAAADAGIQHTLWLLMGANVSPQQICANNALQWLLSFQGKPLAFYRVNYLYANNDTMIVRSRAQDVASTDICQVNEAVLQRGQTRWYMASWVRRPKSFCQATVQACVAQ